MVRPMQSNRTDRGRSSADLRRQDQGSKGGCRPKYCNAFSLWHSGNPRDSVLQGWQSGGSDRRIRSAKRNRRKGSAPVGGRRTGGGRGQRRRSVSYLNRATEKP